MPKKAVGESRASACAVRHTQATIRVLEREFSTEWAQTHVPPILGITSAC